MHVTFDSGRYFRSDFAGEVAETWLVDSWTALAKAIHGRYNFSVDVAFACRHTISESIAGMACHTCIVQRINLNFSGLRDLTAYNPDGVEGAVVVPKKESAPIGTPVPS
jgi:hypothetical protein